jgi:hypothetical protein
VREKRNVYKFLTGNREGMRPLGKYKRRQEDNLNTYFKEIGWEWTGFSWPRIGTSGGVCDHGNKPSGSVKCWEFLH